MKTKPLRVKVCKSMACYIAKLKSIALWLCFFYCKKRKSLPLAREVDLSEAKRRKESKRNFDLRYIVVLPDAHYLSLSLAFASQLPRQEEPLALLQTTKRHNRSCAFFYFSFFYSYLSFFLFCLFFI